MKGVIFVIGCLLISGIAGQRGRGRAGDRHRKSHRPSATTSRIIKGTCDGDKINGVQCNKNYPYRTSTGFCNNLNSNLVSQGSAYTLFKRILPQAYVDGSAGNIARGNGSISLPSASVISQQIHKNFNDPDSARRITHIHMQWGQFLDHDITLTPEGDDHVKTCSECSHSSDPGCFPIQVDSSTCMRFVRSANGNIGGSREQLNQITSFIDASNVYGSEESVSLSLRSGVDGKLIVNTVNGVDMLPQHASQDGCAASNPSTQGCFFAGDVRNTEQLGLTSMHTMWVWYHNKIATDLKQAAANAGISGYDDEKLYQETRRIIGALHQRITYNEFLPVTLGDSVMLQYDINEPPTGNQPISSYNGSCEATLSTEFATAAFRFGHSLIRGIMKNAFGDLNLDGNFFNPDYLYANPQRIKELLYGQCEDLSKEMDDSLNQVLTENLFGSAGQNDGLDLAALNIQRGRDHGIPGYVAYYNHYSGKNLDQNGPLSQLSSVLNRPVIKKLSQVYNKVGDLDLFTGIIAELVTGQGQTDGLMGYVGSRMLANQFRSLKNCDRFFYSNAPNKNRDGPNKHLKKAEIAEIRKMTLSKVLCNFLPANRKIQEFAMQTSSLKRACSSYLAAGQQLDVSKFLSSARGNEVTSYTSTLCLSRNQCTPEATTTQYSGVMISNSCSGNPLSHLSGVGGGRGGGGHHLVHAGSKKSLGFHRRGQSKPATAAKRPKGVSVGVPHYRGSEGVSFTRGLGRSLSRGSRAGAAGGRRQKY